MTDKEIVQALRCCAEGECKDCAMHEDKQRCQENLLDKAAEAIERLTAENAALRENVPLTEDAMINLAAQVLGVEPSRLREIAEADKDGRVLILPCKLGTKVYRIRYKIADYPDKPDLEIADTCFTPEYREDIGKTVFLAREEAEKALQEMKGKP